MIRILTTSLAILAAASPANALSCMMPSVQNSFTFAQEAEESYVLVTGTFTPLPGQSLHPTSDENGFYKSFSVRGEFVGKQANRNGFHTPFSQAVLVEVGCFSQWCGYIPRNEVMTFLMKSHDGYTLSEGPCPHLTFDATLQNKAAALVCLRGGDCKVDR